MKKIISIMLAASTLFGSVVFAKDYPQKFWDVSKDHWAFEYIANLADKGVINGYEDGSFKPTKTASRAEWAKMMVDAAGIIANDNNTSFSDMQNHWANKYVNVAKEFLNTYEDGTFKPDEDITREDATISIIKQKKFNLELIYALNEYDDKIRFSDTVDMSDDSLACIKYATESGIISGFEDGTFRGNNSLTRGEAAALIYRAFLCADKNLVIDTENSVIAELERYNELTKDNIFDKYGHRIAEFPCKYDYDKLTENFLKEINSILPNKSVDTSDIVFKTGVFEENIPVEHYVFDQKVQAQKLYGNKYLLAELPITNEEDKIWEATNEYYTAEDVITPDIYVPERVAYMYYYIYPDGYEEISFLCSDVHLEGDAYREYWKEYEMLEYEQYLKELPTLIKDTKSRLKEIYSYANEDGIFSNYPQTAEKNEILDELYGYIIDYIIDEDMTDLEKVKAVHDWIIANTAYDYKTFNEFLSSNDYDSFTYPDCLLLIGNGVCADFSLLFETFMKKLNIECTTVDGTAAHFGKSLSKATNHAWNLVKVNDEWYHIDVTWDNPSQNIATGNVKYDYFLLSDKQMSEKRQWGYYYWYKDNFIETNQCVLNNDFAPIPECNNEIDVGFSRLKTEYQKPMMK